MSESAGTIAPTSERVFSLTDPGFLADPYSAIARLRESAPAARARNIDGSPMWVFTRDADVRTILSDPRFVMNPPSASGDDAFSARLEVLRAAGVDGELLTYRAVSLPHLDPPEHTRLRGLVSRAFTMRRIAELRPQVERITTDLVTALPGHAKDGVVDLLEHFAYPLPIIVICELVGVPDRDRPLWLECGHRIAGGDVNEAVATMVSHMSALLSGAQTLSEGLLGALLKVHDSGGDRLTEPELIMLVMVLVVAGFETTAHLLSDGMVALLTHPAQLELLRARPDLAPAAVDELARWCTPVLSTQARYAAEPVELGGIRLERGEQAMAVIVGANRDPRRFPDPDRLDITRPVSGDHQAGFSHVAFSHGSHYCLGASLARQEAEIAFGALLARYPELALAVPESELPWRAHPGMRKLARLPIRLSGPASC